MDSVYEVIAIGSAAFIVLMGLWTALRLHGERPFSVLSVLLAGAGPVVALVIYSLTLDIDLKQEAVWGLLAGGAAAGLILGRAIPVYAREDRVFTRVSGWHLLPPMLAIAAIQVTGVQESAEGIILALAGLYAAAAFTVSTSGFLLVRRLGVRPAAAPADGAPAPVPAAGGQRCPRCGSLVRPAWRYCMGCGLPL